MIIQPTRNPLSNPPLMMIPLSQAVGVGLAVGVGVGVEVDVGVGVGVEVDVGVGVAVAVAVAVGVGLAVAVGVGVGVGPDCAQYLPPVLVTVLFTLSSIPPQIIISVPVQAAV
jgi:hypothetical protein